MLQIDPIDQMYMRMALREAETAFDEGEVPVGAVVVCNNVVIGKGYNMVEKLQDATAHAEMIALTAASEYLQSKYLTDCRMYVTLEPCLMCGSATNWAKLGEIVYGAPDPGRGFSSMGNEITHPKTKIRKGIMENDCSALLNEFFIKKRKA